MARDPADEGLRRRGARGGDGEDGGARRRPAAHAPAEGSRTTSATCSSKSAPARAATNRRSSPGASAGCTRATPSARLEGRDRLRIAGRARRLQGSDPADHRPRRLLEAQVRVRRPSRAARAGDRGAGAHPHLRVHGRRDAGSRSGRRHRHQPRRHPHRHVPRVGRGRAAHQQDRFGGADHASRRPASSSNARTTGRSIAIARRRWRCSRRACSTASCASGSRRRRRCARSLVGSGDRSERIRTYNFPQGRVTDHRINLTLHKIDAIMDGDLTSSRRRWRRSTRPSMLAALGDDA